MQAHRSPLYHEQSPYLQRKKFTELVVQDAGGNGTGEKGFEAITHAGTTQRAMEGMTWRMESMEAIVM